MAQHPIVDVLNSTFGGRIASGCHRENDGKACILNVVSKARGVAWTDSPEALDMPDIRPINDAYTDETTRSIDMVRLGVALWDYPQWPLARRVRWAEALAARTVELFGSGLPASQRGDALLTMVVGEWIRIAEESATARYATSQIGGGVQCTSASLKETTQP